MPRKANGQKASHREIVRMRFFFLGMAGGTGPDIDALLAKLPGNSGWRNQVVACRWACARNRRSQLVRFRRTCLSVAAEHAAVMAVTHAVGALLRKV